MDEQTRMCEGREEGKLLGSDGCLLVLKEPKN